VGSALYLLLGLLMSVLFNLPRHWRSLRHATEVPRDR
jgi:polar amino acid transport system permease protein